MRAFVLTVLVVVPLAACTRRPPVEGCGTIPALFEQIREDWEACDRGELGGCLRGGVLAEDNAGGGTSLDEAAAFYRTACDRGLAEGCYHQARVLLRANASTQSQAQHALSSSCEHGFGAACEALASPGPIAWLPAPRATVPAPSPPEPEPTPPPVAPAAPAVSAPAVSPPASEPVVPSRDCTVIARFPSGSDVPEPDEWILPAVRDTLEQHPEMLLLDLESHLGAGEPRQLAQRRVTYVIEQLVALGVAPGRLRARGVDDLEPAAAHPIVEACVAKTASP